MTLSVNGEAVTVPDGTTVAQLVTERAAQPRGVAVARNGEVVPRGSWPETPLAEGDCLELLVAVSGG